MEKVIGYVRVSTETQAEKGYGKDVQVSAIIDYCKANNLELVEVFYDLGISGTSIERDGLTELVAALSEGNIKRIVVMNTSRLWREDTAKVLIKRELQKLDVHICSIEQKDYDIYSKDPNDFLVNGMMELLDQYDRMTLNSKLAKGRREKAKSGVKACGSAPLGYRWKHEGVKKPIVVIEEDRAECVQFIFKSYLELNTLRKVQKRLKEQGYKTQQGKEFSIMSIKNILTNRFYLGEVKHGEMNFDGNHEPLVNKITFGKVQAQLQKNNKRGT